MSKLLIPFISLILLLNISITYSQHEYKPGYIITNDFDTVFGLIAMKSNAQNATSCTFKKDKDSESQDYSPEQIQSYRFIGDKYYVSRKITIGETNRIIFLEYLVNGYTKLYYYKDIFDSYYFIETDSGKTAVLENKEIHFNNKYGDEKVYDNRSYKGVLRYLYKDDDKIIKQINNTKFNSESLIKLSERYHNDMCPGKECIVYVKESTSNKWLSVKAGINHELLKLKTSNDKAVQDRIFIGLQLRIVPKLVSSKWFFMAGINLSKLNTEGDFINDIYGSTRTHRITLNATMLEVPLKIGYNVTNGKVAGGIYFGIHPVYYMNPDFKVRILYGQNSSIADSEFKKFNLGFNTGINLCYKLSDQTNLTFQCGVDLRKPLFFNNHILDNIYFQSIPVSFGLEHKIK